MKVKIMIPVNNLTADIPVSPCDGDFKTIVRESIKEFEYDCWKIQTHITDGGHCIIRLLDKEHEYIAEFNWDKIIGYEVLE